MFSINVIVHRNAIYRHTIWTSSVFLIYLKRICLKQGVYDWIVVHHPADEVEEPGVVLVLLEPREPHQPIQPRQNNKSLSKTIFR